MRVSAFEVFMGIALVVLLGWFVIPRVISGAPEVKASQAVALQLELEKVYVRWQQAGGQHGRGESDKTLLTRNILSCLTSQKHVPYKSKEIAPRNLGYSGVYEKPSLSPSPADVRLGSFVGCKLPVGKIKTHAGDKKAVLLGGAYGVLFDGHKWTVWPVM